MKFIGFSVPLSNTTVSSSSDAVVQKNCSFWSCYFKGNQFHFGSSEIYANVWAQSPSHTQVHALESLGGGRPIFQLGKETVWASIYKTDTCVYVHLEAGYHPRVSVNYSNSHQKSRCYWWKKQGK